jgi:hypothetical protein
MLIIFIFVEMSCKEELCDYWAERINLHILKIADRGEYLYTLPIICGQKTNSEYLCNDIVIDVKRKIEESIPNAKCTYKCLSVTPIVDTVLEITW